jgi:hypothetical protein
MADGRFGDAGNDVGRTVSSTALTSKVDSMGRKNQSDGRWAPWWLYVVIIVGSNYVKQYFVQDWPVIINAAITLVLVGALFLGITAVYRSIHGAARQQR